MYVYTRVAGRITPNHLIDWIFVAGSGMLGLSIALNSVSTHATCTAVFVAISAIAGIGFASIRTLGRISWLAWIGLIAIITASKASLKPGSEQERRRKRIHS